MKPIAFRDQTDNRILAFCWATPDFIPVVVGGRLHPVARTEVRSLSVPNDIPPEDYVLGLEALGCVLSYGTDGIPVTIHPVRWRSASWKDWALQIETLAQSFGDEANSEVSIYLRRRIEG